MCVLVATAGTVPIVVGNLLLTLFDQLDQHDQLCMHLILMVDYAS